MRHPGLINSFSNNSEIFNWSEENFLKVRKIIDKYPSGKQQSAVIPVLDLIDLVLIMSVHPGFGGQKFLKENLEKVKILKKEINLKKSKTLIEIDGGINFENSKIAKEAGVDILVSGTTIFKENKGNLKKNIKLLRTG